MTILTVFRSRAQALDCTATLRAAGIPAATVNTPKEAGVGCGLSVKIEENFLPRVKMLVRQKRYSAFAGYLKRVGNTFVAF